MIQNPSFDFTILLLNFQIRPWQKRRPLTCCLIHYLSTADSVLYKRFMCFTSRETYFLGPQHATPNHKSLYLGQPSDLGRHILVEYSTFRRMEQERGLHRLCIGLRSHQGRKCQSLKYLESSLEKVLDTEDGHIYLVQQSLCPLRSAGWQGTIVRSYKVQGPVQGPSYLGLGVVMIICETHEYILELSVR